VRAIKLTNGNLLIPKRAEGPGRLIGDGAIEVGPDSPEYEAWLPFATEPPGVEIGRRIRTERRRRGWTMKELATKTGLSFTTISRLENGPKAYRYGGRCPNLWTMRRIAQAFEMNLEELAGSDYLL